MAKVLIARLSAAGDVAMTIPVLYSVAKENPKDSFTLLTQSFLKTLFINKPENLEIIGLNTKKTEKSLGGFLRFSLQLVKNKYDIYIDLHDVLRSRILGFLFQLKNKPTFRLDKRRRERKLLVKKPPKNIQPLRSMTQCYSDVFMSAGFKFNTSFISLFNEHSADLGFIEKKFGNKCGAWIGVAPFAKHAGKVYPIDKMETIVDTLSKQNNFSIFLFGAKGYEESVLSQWETKFHHTYNIAGLYSLDQELALISQLDAMITMDSANMHFASLVGTKVVSIWGATHPFAGFYGYNQPPDLIVQVSMPCRPCSIFGNKPCYRGDWACMNSISPEQVVKKINDLMNNEDRSKSKI